MKKAMLMTALLLTTAVYADGDDKPKPSNCGKLNVLITNATNKLCSLQSQVLNHGFFMYTSSAPAFIPAGVTAHPFILTQSMIFGPDIDLTYRCGDDSFITIHSKQNYCFWSGGNITGSVLNANRLHASYSATTGSAFWNQHGSINWVISN